MSRTRNRRSPFWATGLSQMHPGAASVTRGLSAMLQRSGLDLIWPGSGYRPGGGEHGGRAMDWIIVENVGDRPNPAERAQALDFLAFLVRNYGALGIQGIIFSRDGKNRSEIIGYSRPFSAGWRPLANRGSVPANHIDHIHVYHTTSAAFPAAYARVNIPTGAGASGGAGSSRPTPGLPNTGATITTPTAPPVPEEDQMTPEQMAELKAHIADRVSAAVDHLGNRAAINRQATTTASLVSKLGFDRPIIERNAEAAARQTGAILDAKLAAIRVAVDELKAAGGGAVTDDMVERVEKAAHAAAFDGGKKGTEAALAAGVEGSIKIGGKK